MMYMLTRVCLSLVLLWSSPSWSQIGSIPYELPPTSANDAQMLTPPPVSIEGYTMTVGSQMRSNYLDAGLTFNSAYTDNVQPSASTTPIGDFIYTILPTLTLHRTTQRQQLALTYSPGFTFYHPTSTLNVLDQNAAVTFQYRLSQHTTFILSDSLQKSSNIFDQLYPISGGAISGSSQTTPVGAVAPYADQLRNTANMGVSYQLSRNGMIGASGVVAESNYATSSQASDFYNSHSVGGSVFYSQRLSSTQYIGGTYQYSISQSDPVNAQTTPQIAQPEVRTSTFFAFYTIYLNPTLSLSLSVGPQHTDATQPPSLSFSSWTPSVMASIGWQRSRTNFVASYLRTVTGGLGLAGVFDSYGANASVGWQIARTWTVGSAASYSNNTNVALSFPSSTPGGQTVSGTASVQHSMSEHLNMELGYAHFHQNYIGIAPLSSAPDSNREYISISYRFTRPLGR
jgi:hypothetical protein